MNVWIWRLSAFNPITSSFGKCNRQYLKVLFQGIHPLQFFVQWTSRYHSLLTMSLWNRLWHTHTHFSHPSFATDWKMGRTNSSYATCTIRATVDKQKIASPARFKFQALPVILRVSQQSVHRSWRLQSWSYQPRSSPFSIGANGRTGGGITYKQGE